MNKIFIVAGICLLVLVGGIAGAYYTGYFTPKASIRVGILQGDIHHLAVQVAIVKDLYGQNGLNITRYTYTSGPALMQSFLAGELDFAYVGVPPAMSARANAMASGNITNLPVVIGSANLEGSALVVNPNKITSINDLNGKKIGTPGAGTIQDTLLTIYARDHNITVTKFQSSNANLPIQFNNGEMDGLIAWEPTPSIVVNQSNATVLLTSHDIFPDHQCCVLVVNQNFLVAHPDIVAKMLTVHNAANNYINNNRGEVAQIASDYTQKSLQIVNHALDNVIYNNTVNIESVRAFLDAMIQLRIITSLNQTQEDSFLSGLFSSQYINP